MGSCHHLLRHVRVSMHQVLTFIVLKSNTYLSILQILNPFAFDLFFLPTSSFFQQLIILLRSLTLETSFEKDDFSWHNSTIVTPSKIIFSISLYKISYFSTLHIELPKPPLIIIITHLLQNNSP